MFSSNIWDLADEFSRRLRQRYLGFFTLANRGFNGDLAYPDQGWERKELDAKCIARHVKTFWIIRRIQRDRPLYSILQDRYTVLGI